MRVATDVGPKFQPSWNLNFKALIALSYAPPEVRAEVEERASGMREAIAKQLEVDQSVVRSALLAL